MTNLVFSPHTPLSKAKKQSRVAILLCTYNGGKFLSHQLNSFLTQSIDNITVYASDDGSSDNTLDVLKGFSTQLKICICDGPRKGFAQNFQSLVLNEKITGDYFAFSDQDDIWEDDKLKRAIDCIDKYPIATPVLYCSRMSLMNEEGVPLGLSPEYSIAPSFENALIESISCGNSMVFNKAARDLIKECSKNVIISSHDWWSYIVITGCGGTVLLDNHPTVRYRQHHSNLVGMDYSLRARILRFNGVLCGQWQKLINVNINAIKFIDYRLTPRNMLVFKLFYKGRTSSNFLTRMMCFYRSGIHKKNMLGNITLAVAAIFNKL